jgi:hypothetical protein
MKDSGYKQSIKDAFIGMTKTTVKRVRMTDAENRRALDVRRRREDIEEAMAIRKAFEEY